MSTIVEREVPSTVFDLLYDHDDHDYYVRGHINLEDTLYLLRRDSSEFQRRFPDNTLPPNVRITHVHARCVPPTKSQREYEGWAWVLHECERGRGAFPLTKLEYDW